VIIANDQWNTAQNTIRVKGNIDKPAFIDGVFKERQVAYNPVCLVYRDAWRFGDICSYDDEFKRVKDTSGGIDSLSIEQKFSGQHKRTRSECLRQQVIIIHNFRRYVSCPNRIAIMRFKIFQYSIERCSVRFAKQQVNSDS